MQKKPGSINKFQCPHDEILAGVCLHAQIFEQRICLGHVFALDWHAGFNLKGFFIVSDGVKAEEDPNLYDLSVSVKFQGPAYRKGSTKANGIFFERAMQVPVSAKLGNR